MGRFEKKLQCLKGDVKIAIANINKEKYLGVKMLLSFSNANISIVGGWNFKNSNKAILVKKNSIPVFKDIIEFMSNISIDKQPNTIVFLPESNNIYEEIRKVSLKNIETIIIVWGFKNEISLSEMKKIASISEENKVKVITMHIKDIGYNIGYLLDNVKNMPWTINRLDSDLLEYLKQFNINKGTFLDLGTGSGNQAVELSKLGFKVTATDLVRYAFIENQSKEKDVEFIEDDLLNSKLDRKFDYIFDRGCLHALGKSNYKKYVLQIRKLLNDGGKLFLKYVTNENKQLTADVLEYYLSKEDLYNFIKKNFIVEQIKDAVYEQSYEKVPLKSTFAVLSNK
ncbi:MULTISPECIES: class I SAM-dependent methyltransferase [Clostridium]|uniref:class I SAM-dependent methyltransferase n=1 Tax=Clostridium TaxID=1485 RepID=UPI0008268958|nr:MULTISPECIES: class I SAM-dependent methyltransferase [Clostridium]